MDGGVATGAEAGALLEEALAGKTGVRDFADQRGAGGVGRGDLGVAFEAEIVVALNEQLRVDRAVDVVTGDAAFAEGFVFEDVGASLFFVALRAGLVDASDELAGGFVDVFAVRVMAGGAIEPAFLERVVVLQTEFRFLVEVTLETVGRIFAGEDEFAFAAAGIHVQAAGAVTGFAAEAGHFVFLDGFPELDAGVLGEFEVLNFFLVADGALIHADVLGAGNHRWGNDDAFDRGAGDGQRDDGGTENRPDHDRFCEAHFSHWSPRCNGSRAALW